MPTANGLPNEWDRTKKNSLIFPLRVPDSAFSALYFTGFMHPYVYAFMKTELIFFAW